jgi:monoamine oxidase
VTGVAPRAVAGLRWSEEPWTRGTYLILGPGHLTTWGGRLVEPHGRIHFAGAEASTLPSYMEGAARAGERAAAEILALTG